MHFRAIQHKGIINALITKYNTRQIEQQMQINHYSKILTRAAIVKSFKGQKQKNLASTRKQARLGPSEHDPPPAVMPSGPTNTRTVFRSPNRLRR